MPCQIAFYGSPAEYAPLFGEPGAVPGVSFAAVIPAGKDDDPAAFPGVTRFSSLKEALLALPFLEGAAFSPSLQDNRDGFFENAALALSYGKHLFAKIPPDLPAAKAKELLELAKASGSLFFPFVPGIGSASFQTARELLSARAFGEILTVSEESPIPSSLPEEGLPESLRELFLPALFRMRLLCGRPGAVSALYVRSGEARAEGRLSPDAALLQLVFDTGAAASVLFRPGSADKISPSRLLIAGVDESTVVDPEFSSNGDSGDALTEYAEEVPSLQRSELQASFEEFLNALLTEEPRAALPPEALLFPELLRISDAAVSSALSGGAQVTLPPSSF